MKFISRLFAEYAIQIREGAAISMKGKTIKRVLNDISALAKEFDIEQGEIWIDQLGKVSFSGEIPEKVRTKIRNVIFSL